jgi:hypothetical protein
MDHCPLVSAIPFPFPSLFPSCLCRGVDVALSLRRGGRAASTPLKLSMQMEHPQWPQFVDYNLGKWSGRALHISAENGEYTEPYVKSYSAEVAEDDNSVVETITEIDGNESRKPASRTPPCNTPSDISGAGKPAAGKPKPTAMTKDENKSVSLRITGGAGGFDASDDGSYALDRWVTKIPGTDDTARLQIEMSIALGKDERVRCREWYPDPCVHSVLNPAGAAICHLGRTRARSNECAARTRAART